MAQNITKKQEMINRILGIVKGELPAKRVALCICWDDDPEHPDEADPDWNVFLVDGRLVDYSEWKRFFGKIEIKENE